MSVHLAPAAGDPLVLVVEDDEDILGLVRHRLEHAGCRVLAARRGADALALAAEHHPQVLLLDVGLPDLSGFEVCSAIQSARDAQPAVIFLTAHDSIADRVRGLELGAVDYVVKPFDSAELVARVHAALRTKRLVDELTQDASTDPLTGLLNRRQLESRLGEYVALARRGRPLACLLLDLDRFKCLNDALGEPAGDAVLREVGVRIRGALRASDLVFRYGGAEFLVLLPETDLTGAEVAAENLVRAVTAAPVELPEAGRTVPVSVSVGVEAWRQGTVLPGELIAGAGAALYRAKLLGRGRVALAH